MKFSGAWAVILAVTLMSGSVSATELESGVFCDEKGNPLTGIHYGYEISSESNLINSSDKIFEGSIIRDSLMWIFDDKGYLQRPYTGFTDSEKGRRYYSFGERVIGWYKMPEGWRHFDSNGYMSVGKTEIAGCNYYFDESGLWTNKLNKSGLAPEDFSIYFKLDTDRSFVGNETGFYCGVNDSSSEKFYWANVFVLNDDGEEVYGESSRKISFSSADRQVLYSMFLESGFWEADLLWTLGDETRTLGDEYLHEYMDKHNRDENGYIKRFTDVYQHDVECGDGETASHITVTAGGKTYSVIYGEHLIGQLAYNDGTSRAVILLSDSLRFYDRYLETEYPQRFD